MAKKKWLYSWRKYHASQPEEESEEIWRENQWRGNQSKRKKKIEEMTNETEENEMSKKMKIKLNTTTGAMAYLLKAGAVPKETSAGARLFSWLAGAGSWLKAAALSAKANSLSHSWPWLNWHGEISVRNLWEEGEEEGRRVSRLGWL